MPPRRRGPDPAAHPLPFFLALYLYHTQERNLAIRCCGRVIPTLVRVQVFFETSERIFRAVLRVSDHFGQTALIFLRDPGTGQVSNNLRVQARRYRELLGESALRGAARIVARSQIPYGRQSGLPVAARSSSFRYHYRTI